jgi:short-subunit dehydrogenase
MGKPVFQENVVIITGASLGIGRELAFQLAGQGAWLVLASRTPDTLEEVAVRCRQLGGRAVSIPTDVSVQTQCKRMVEATLGEYGRIDTLVNNAGLGQHAKFHKLQDLTTFEKVIRINFFGSVYCTHYALPGLIESAGRLVAVSSLRGRFPSATADGYGESKHALAGFYDNLRLELAGTGVSVTSIFCGWVSTGISSRAIKPDGTVTGVISRHEKGAMPVDTCVRIILRAMEKRKRQVVMTMEGKLGLWLRLIAPGYIDRLLRSKTS